MGISPTQRSLAYLRNLGYHVSIVEHFNHWTKRRNDLWGFADLLAIRPGEILAVQVTSGSNVSARVKKIADSEIAPKVREAGIAIHIHGWRRLKSGWAPKIIDLS